MDQIRFSVRGYTIFEIILIVVFIGVLVFVGIRLTSQSDDQQETSFHSTEPKRQTQPDNDVYPEVWTKNGYDGESYEFKSNCGPDYDTLETCFLYDVTRVTVTNPSGKVFELDKDFNVNEFSGEITRRWVLYGPPDGKLPESGTYKFEYYENDDVTLTQAFDYQPQIISYPSNISWQQDGNDLLVNWTPPDGVQQGMWYKVLIFHGSEQPISQEVEWDANSARLINVPLNSGEEASLNVSSYFSGGYAYPKNIDITWQ
jgi:hypothetical protein